MAEKKHPGAVALGKLRMQKLTAAQREEFARTGGRIGGKKRAEALSAKRRKEIAQKAAEARWGKRKAEGGKAKQ